MRTAGANKLVFSSTAAVFGNPQNDKLAEDHPRAPINPYGWSKRMVEQMLEDMATAWGLNSVALRYFNACGAHSSGEIGEAHDPETHLIPVVLLAALGVRDSLKLFGDDYDTPDGTCIRDYIHVMDLASAKQHYFCLLRLIPNDSRPMPTFAGHAVRPLGASPEAARRKPE